MRTGTASLKFVLSANARIRLLASLFYGNPDGGCMAVRIGRVFTPGQWAWCKGKSLGAAMQEQKIGDLITSASIPICQ
jgi:hypothetical protein